MQTVEHFQSYNIGEKINKGNVVVVVNDDFKLPMVPLYKRQ